MCFQKLCWFWFVNFFNDLSLSDQTGTHNVFSDKKYKPTVTDLFGKFTTINRFTALNVKTPCKDGISYYVYLVTENLVHWYGVFFVIFSSILYEVQHTLLKYCCTLIWCLLFNIDPIPKWTATLFICNASTLIWCLLCYILLFLYVL